MNTDEAWESFMSIRKASSKGYADTIAAALNDIKTDTAKLTKLTNRLLGDQGMLESSAGTAPTDDLGGAPGGDMTGGMELPDNTEERGALDDAMNMLGDKAGAEAPQAAAAADMDAAQADQDMAAADVGDAVADMDVSAADQTLPETGAGMTPDQALPQPEATFETACVQFSETVKQELQKAASEGDYYKARRLIEIVTAIDKIVESDGNPDTVLKGEESTDNDEVTPTGGDNVGEPNPGATPEEVPGEASEETPENEKVRKSCSEESIDKAIWTGGDPETNVKTQKFLERHGIRGSNFDEDMKVHGTSDYGTREEDDDDDDDDKDIKKSNEKGEYESADPITDGTGKRGSPRPGEEAETAHADPVEVSKTTSSEGTREAEGFTAVDMTKSEDGDDDIGKTDDGAPVADEGMTGSVEGDNVASSCKKSASMPSFKDLMASRQSEGSDDLYVSFMKSATEELQHEVDEYFETMSIAKSAAEGDISKGNRLYQKVADKLETKKRMEETDNDEEEEDAYQRDWTEYNSRHGRTPAEDKSGDDDEIARKKKKDQAVREVKTTPTSRADRSGSYPTANSRLNPLARDVHGDSLTGKEAPLMAKSAFDAPAPFSELMAKHRKPQRGLRKGC